MKPDAQFKISLMMFLQFFAWGAWFATLGQCLGANEFSADVVGAAYGSSPLGAIFAPLFLGLIADRFFPSQVVMGVLFILGGILLLLVPITAQFGDSSLMIWLMVGNMLCYMPTVGLGNSIAFAHLDRLTFPKVRVWGTIGWIAAGLTVGFLGWSSLLDIFYLAGAVSLLLGFFSFSLPNTPPPAKGEPVNLRALLMLDAFTLLKRPAFAVFLACSCLICIPLAYYYGLTSNYLSNAGFKEAASTMTIGQTSEIFFMLLIPFFFRRLGVKNMILIGMLAWVARYLLFAFGASEQVVWMLLLSVALHGICYDFFFVTGFMYTDKVAPAALRTQAQSLLVFFTQGIGMYFGYQVAFGRFGNEVTKYGELNGAIAGNRAVEQLGFGEQLGRMFAVDLPAPIDPGLLAETMLQWENFWIYPALMAGGIAVIFFLAFWDKVEISNDA